MKLSEITQDTQTPQNIKLSDINNSSDIQTQAPIQQQNRLPVESNNLAPEKGQDNLFQNLGILGNILSHPIQNRNVLSDAISNTGKQTVNNLADLGNSTINTVKSIPQIPGTALQSVLHPILTGKAIGGAIGNKIGQYNTIDKVAEKVSNDPFGYGSDVINTVSMGMAAKKMLGPEIGKLKILMPKAYNDALINKTGQDIVSKVQGAITPLKEQYKSLTSPFIEKPVDSETFQKALSVLPKEMQQDFIDKYGTAILDANGKPQTNVGNLHAMELGLKDDIQQPKYGQSINAESYDIAKAVKQIKQVRLSQYPEGTQNAISNLDKKFGPVMDMTSYLLPKISNKAGVINTKTLYNIFNNPTDAGTRQYLVGLKGLGVDLTPEMKTLKGWIGRQRAKSFVKGVTGKIAEGGAIGTVLKAGTGD